MYDTYTQVYTRARGSVSLQATHSGHQNVTWSVHGECPLSRGFSLTRRDRRLEIIEELFLFNGAHRVGVDAEDAGGQTDAEKESAAPDQSLLLHASPVDRLQAFDI